MGPFEPWNPLSQKRTPGPREEERLPQGSSIFSLPWRQGASVSCTACDWSQNVGRSGALGPGHWRRLVVGGGAWRPVYKGCHGPSGSRNSLESQADRSWG